MKSSLGFTCAVAACGIAGLTGCPKHAAVNPNIKPLTIVVKQPAANATVRCPVAIEIAWLNPIEPNSLDVKIAGQDYTSQFANLNTGPATASLPLPTSGPLKLDVTANLKIGGIFRPVGTSENFSVDCTRITGAFTEVPISFKVPPQSGSSADGVATVLVSSDPSAPNREAAAFKSNSMPPVTYQPSFDPMPSNAGQAGAAFCSGPTNAPATLGIVLSGSAPGNGTPPGQAVYTIVDMRKHGGSVSQTVGVTKGTVTVAPRIFFSPDCSVALTLGANISGTTDEVVQVFDSRINRIYGAVPLGQGDIFSATLATRNGKQYVDVKVNNTNTQSFLLPTQ